MQWVVYTQYLVVVVLVENMIFQRLLRNACILHIYIHYDVDALTLFKRTFMSVKI
jgi:hypothetical protein